MHTGMIDYSPYWGAFQSQGNIINEATEQKNNLTGMAAGKPVGYLQVQLSEVEPSATRIKFNQWLERVSFLYWIPLV